MPRSVQREKSIELSTYLSGGDPFAECPRSISLIAKDALRLEEGRSIRLTYMPNIRNRNRRAERDRCFESETIGIIKTNRGYKIDFKIGREIPSSMSHLPIKYIDNEAILGGVVSDGSQVYVKANIVPRDISNGDSFGIGYQQGQVMKYFIADVIAKGSGVRRKRTKNGDIKLNHSKLVSGKVALRFREQRISSGEDVKV